MNTISMEKELPNQLSSPNKSAPPITDRKDSKQPLSQEEALLQPYRYLLDHPGKDLRSKWIQAFEHWMPLHPSHTTVIRDVIAMLHTSSLMIDDIEDNSELRRGVPSTHKVFGIPSTINSANYVYFVALDKVMKLQAIPARKQSISTDANDEQPQEDIEPDSVDEAYQKSLSFQVARIFTDELLMLHKGQGMDIYWRDQLVCPTVDDYYEMVGNKTGGLLRLAVKLMEACSGTKVDYVPLVNLIGIHYQIRDDYLNLKSTKYMDTKGFAEDLTEGKFSFPIVYYIHQNPSEKPRIIDFLSKRTTDISLKKEFISLLESDGTFTAIEGILTRLETDIRSMITTLGGNPILEKLMDYLSSCT